MPGSFATTHAGCQTPVNGAPQPIRKRRPADKPKALLRPAHIQLAPWLAVGLACVPHDAPVAAGQPGDGFEQVFDADLKGAADVDRGALVVAFAGEQDALGGVLDIEKLTRR